MAVTITGWALASTGFQISVLGFPTTILHRTTGVFAPRQLHFLARIYDYCLDREETI